MDDAPLQLLKISLRDVLFILFLKLHVMIGVFLIIVGGTALYFQKVTPIYMTSASILLKPILDSRTRLRVQNRYSIDQLVPEDINTEIKIMSASDFKHLVLKNLSDKNIDAKKELATLDIRPVTASNMIFLSLEGKNPSKITIVLNTFVDLFIDRHIDARKTGSGSAFYVRRAENSLQKLNGVEKNYQDFQKKFSIIDVKVQNDYNIKLIQLLHQELSQLRVEIAEKSHKLGELNKMMNQTGEITAMTKEFRESDSITALYKSLSPLTIELERIGLLYPELSVEYQDTYKQVKKFKQQIIKEQKKILRGMEIDLSSIINRADALEHEIQQIDIQSKLIAEKDIERNSFTRDISYFQDSYRLYKEKVEEALISEQRETARLGNLFINSWAHKPSDPIYPERKKMLILSIAAGCVVGVGAAFATFFLDQTIKRPEDLEKNCGVPVIATLGVVRFAQKK
ncbi:hypothetical protein QUF90_19485 [Desulfococcaceae bacterium HSG9]|nr:hypothetical protein [Desulfococcaceae bacterium HSG9]